MWVPDFNAAHMFTTQLTLNPQVCARTQRIGLASSRAAALIHRGMPVGQITGMLDYVRLQQAQGRLRFMSWYHGPQCVGVSNMSPPALLARRPCVATMVCGPWAFAIGVNIRVLGRAHVGTQPLVTLQDARVIVVHTSGGALSNRLPVVVLSHTAYVLPSSLEALYVGKCFSTTTSREQASASHHVSGHGVPSRLFQGGSSQSQGSARLASVPTLLGVGATRCIVPTPMRELGLTHGFAQIPAEDRMCVPADGLCFYQCMVAALEVAYWESMPYKQQLPKHGADENRA